MTTNLKHLDYSLRQRTESLLNNGELDSAIRKALVILKTRVCTHLGVSMEIDGDKLVNHVFGPTSQFMPKLTSSEREAYRCLFAAMYGLLRNRFMHRDLTANYLEVDAVFSNVNLFLKLIGDFHFAPFDILIIESEPPILDRMSSLMAGGEYTFEIVKGLKSAKNLVGRKGTPSVLITDRVYFSQDAEMDSRPRVFSYDLVNELRDANPNLRVIFTSDYALNRPDDHPNDIEVRKPFTDEQFVGAVTSVMESLLR